MIDPIVEEVRAVRDAYAAKFNRDFDATLVDIQKQERLSGRTYVTYPSRPARPKAMEEAK